MATQLGDIDDRADDVTAGTCCYSREELVSDARHTDLVPVGVRAIGTALPKWWRCPPLLGDCLYRRRGPRRHLVGSG
nr:hypothetical protein [Kibdelosporangium sp. MJ126-NF4]